MPSQPDPTTSLDHASIPQTASMAHTAFMPQTTVPDDVPGTAPLRFLDLPKDIRLMVYDLLCDTEMRQFLVESESRCAIAIIQERMAILNTSILAACRTTFSEAVAIKRKIANWDTWEDGRRDSEKEYCHLIQFVLIASLQEIFVCLIPHPHHPSLSHSHCSLKLLVHDLIDFIQLPRVRKRKY